MNICRHCKKNPGVFCDSKNKYGTKYYTCKSCNTARSKRYRQTESGKRVYKEIMHRQYWNHREKILARAKLGRAVRKGEIIKPLVCSKCERIKKLQAHHPDYKYPLDVIWLCRTCHLDI